MDSRKLEILMTAVDLGSLSRAAEVVGYTQSGLTHLVDSLEREIGLTLVQRDHSGIALTEEGNALMPAIREFLRANARLENQISAITEKSAQTIRVAAYASIAMRWMPEILYRFRRVCPHIDVDLRTVDHELEPFELLEAWRTDVIFAARQSGFACDWTPLHNDAMYAILPADYPTDGRETFPITEYEGRDFLMPYGRFDIDVGAAFRKYGVRPVIRPCHVDDETVIRMVGKGLGISMMAEMMIRGKLTSIQRIKASEGELSGSDLVTNVLQRDMEKIRMAMDQTDGSEFSHVVDIIAQAKHIYIVGFRSSSFLAGYLNFYFRLIYDNVTQVQGGAAGTFDQLFRVGPGDVVIAICFPRYSELALKTVQYAKDRGATIIGVTDSEMSPVYQMSSGSLLVRNEMISFVDSLAAPMSMLNALILAAAHKQGTDISATFNELEHVWDRFGIFGKVEDE